MAPWDLDSGHETPDARGAGASSPGEGVEAVGLPGVGKCHAQAGHERRVQDHGCTLVPRGQVHGGDGPDALAVQDDVLRAHAVPAEVRGHVPSANEREKTKDKTHSISLSPNSHITSSHVHALA